MSPRQARRERREAERKAKKAELKRVKAAVEQPIWPSVPRPVLLSAAPFFPQRAEINRRNAQHSTGPKTETGKLASSRNSLKHGLASGELLIPGEDPAAFEALLADLIDEHRPAGSTEHLLIQEMAQSWWLSQRALRLQAGCFTENPIDEKRLALFLRYQTTHERAFHKALNALLRLQKEHRKNPNGFVSQNAAAAAASDGFVSQNDAEAAPLHGFVSQNAPRDEQNPPLRFEMSAA